MVSPPRPARLENFVARVRGGAAHPTTVPATRAKASGDRRRSSVCPIGAPNTLRPGVSRSPDNGGGTDIGSKLPTMDKRTDGIEVTDGSFVARPRVWAGTRIHDSSLLPRKTGLREGPRLFVVVLPGSPLNEHLRGRTAQITAVKNGEVWYSEGGVGGRVGRGP